MLELGCLISYAHTLEWRRQRQTQNPEDKRNSHAIAILDSLEVQIAALNRGPLHKRLLRLWEAEGRCSGERDRFSEIVSEELGAVGFRSFPVTGKELLEAILGRLEELNDFEEEEAQALEGRASDVAAEWSAGSAR
jgi:hypothetical protein